MDKPDTVLFDLDGTIVDSRVAYVRSLNNALAAVGLPTHAPEELHRYLGPPMHETLRSLGVPGELEPRINELYRERYVREGLGESVLFDGVRELLEALSGHARIALATSKARPLANALLRRLGLWELFDAVAGADPEAISEPKSTTIQTALDRLAALYGSAGGSAGSAASVGSGGSDRGSAGFAPGSRIMVGDRRYDVEGARVHGIATIGVLWGVGSERELREAGAAALASTPAELAALLGL